MSRWGVFLGAGQPAPPKTMAYGQLPVIKSMALHPRTAQMNFLYGWTLITIGHKTPMRIKLFILSIILGFANCFAGETATTNLAKYFALGQSTNDISLGILTNSSESNIFVCLLYVGQTNSRQFWVAPPQFQRVEYYLYDSSAKVVPYLATYHPINKNYETISEVPKNVNNVHEGIMWSPFPMPYDQAILTNIFQIEHSGNYKLIVKGRIMKINADSSLSMVKFPPVSLAIHLGDEDVSKENK